MASQQEHEVMEASEAENNPGCNNNNNNNTLARWPLSKYANLIISKKPGTGTWQERTAGQPNDMWIQITQVRLCICRRVLFILKNRLLFLIHHHRFFTADHSVVTFKFFTLTFYSSAAPCRTPAASGGPFDAVKTCSSSLPTTR